MKASDFIDALRRQLNDEGNKVTWSDALIMDALNEAICYMAEVRPDVFEEAVDVEVSGTGVLEPPEGYSTISEVIENVDPVTGKTTGRSIQEMDPSKTPNGDRYSGIDCHRGSNVRMVDGLSVATVEQAQAIGQGRQAWRLSPPVPDDSVANIKVMAVRSPTRITSQGSTLPDHVCRIMSVIRSFVLMRMFEVDTESAYAADHARRYQQQVEQFAGAQYRQQAVYQSGWYMGQEGSGDEEARRR